MIPAAMPMTGQCSADRKGRKEEKMRIQELIIYKNLEQEQILNDMTFLMENYDNEYYNKEDLKSLLFECTGSILSCAWIMGLRGISGMIT